MSDHHREDRPDLGSRAERLAIALERMNVAGYVELLNDTKRLIYVNFVAGLARGLGIAVGFGVLGALTLYLLQRTVMLNLPVIGNVIAELVAIVQQRLSP